MSKRRIAFWEALPQMVCIVISGQFLVWAFDFPLKDALLVSFDFSAGVLTAWLLWRK